GGSFTNIGGQTRNRIARLDAATGSADSFDPNANNKVNAIAVQADGKILVGGGFGGVNSNGGQAVNRITRIDPKTNLPDSLAPNGGGAVTRNSIARLERNGRLDQTLDLSVLGNFVLAAAVQPDGKVLIGGAFGSVLGVTRNNMARLNTDGTLDTAFDPNANFTVFEIAVQAVGKILAGGSFTNIGG